jgi:hypothetical protein
MEYVVKGGLIHSILKGNVVEAALIEPIFSEHIAECAPITSLLDGYVDREALLGSHHRGTAVKREICCCQNCLASQ